MFIVDLINKDVDDANETKRGMVSIRVLYLTIFIAFILDIMFAGPEVLLAFVCRFAIAFVAMILLFVDTYRVSTKTAFIGLVLFLLVWVIAMIRCFGWSAGMQNYFIVILLLCFFATHGKLSFKFTLVSYVLVARIITILVYSGTEPVVPISPIADKLIQIVNISAVFSSIIFISYMYSKKENAEESKLMQYNSRLQQEANTDQLTGLFNRRRTREYLTGLAKNAQGRAISIAMGDIDFFKKVNDTYGHDAGDEVLKMVADTIKECCGDIAFISRWGGEEFLLIFPGLNGDEAYNQVEKIRQTVEFKSITVNSMIIKVTMTYGLTEYDFENGLDATIKDADNKLYTGKSSGRNRVIY